MRVDVAAALLRKCKSHTTLQEGRRIHAQIRADGLDRNTFLVNLLIFMYSNCGSPEEARSAFTASAAPRNIYSWTILLQALAHNGQLQKARDVLYRMPHTDVIAWNALIAAHGRHSEICAAQELFDATPEKDLVSWNCLLTAYAQNGKLHKALEILRDMDLEGTEPDSISFLVVLDAVSGADSPDVATARILCQEVVDQGLYGKTSVGTALVSTLSRLGDIQSAISAFHKIAQRNLISWNAMLAAFARNDDIVSANEMLDRMPQRDVISWTTILAAVVQANRHQESRVLFDQIPERDVVAWNALMFADARSSDSDLAQAKLAFERSPKHDLASRTSGIVICALSGDVEGAIQIFDQTPRRDLPLMNSMITAHLRNGSFHQALEIFFTVDLPDRLSVLLAIEACAGLGDPELSASVHICTKKLNLNSDIGICSAMIRMYARSGAIDEAISIFVAMNRVPDLWSPMIAAYAFNGWLNEAIQLHEEMPRRDSSSWLIILKAYTQQGYTELAAQTLMKLPEWNSMACNSVLAGYVSSGEVDKARGVFDSIDQENKTLFTWNLMISGYAQCGYVREILQLLKVMGLAPDRGTFLAALDSCACRSTSADECRTIHEFAIQTGWNQDLGVATSLVNAYGKCRSVEDAKAVFDSIPEPSVVSGNCMLRAYAQSGNMSDARELFAKMVVRDVVSWNTLAMGYALAGHTNEVMMVRSLAPRWDCASLNAVMMFHAQEGRVDEARRVFESLREIDPGGVAISLWNSMCSIYLQAGFSRAAVETCWEMSLEGVDPDRITLLSLFDAYGKLTAVAEGRLLHGDVLESRLRFDMMLSNAIINFYGKCGCVEGALKTFESLQKRDIVSWNGLGAAYAQNGYISEAEEVIWRMNLQGISPDEVTYVNLLSACSHAGFLKDGRHHFHCLMGDYAIYPTLDHFMCVVDLLGRLGRLDECQELIESMPFEPGWVAWMTLLGACKVHREVELGNSTIPKFCHTGAASYVLISNLYLD